MNNEDKVGLFVVLTLAALTFIVAAVVVLAITMDSLTNDERNQLPRCDTVEEVLVGIGDFYNGRWDDYTCVDGR